MAVLGPLCQSCIRVQLAKLENESSNDNVLCSDNILRASASGRGMGEQRGLAASGRVSKRPCAPSPRTSCPCWCYREVPVPRSSVAKHDVRGASSDIMYSRVHLSTRCLAMFLRSVFEGYPRSWRDWRAGVRMGSEGREEEGQRVRQICRRSLTLHLAHTTAIRIVGQPPHPSRLSWAQVSCVMPPCLICLRSSAHDVRFPGSVGRRTPLHASPSSFPLALAMSRSTCFPPLHSLSQTRVILPSFYLPVRILLLILPSLPCPGPSSMRPSPTLLPSHRRHLSSYASFSPAGCGHSSLLRPSCRAPRPSFLILRCRFRCTFRFFFHILHAPPGGAGLPSSSSASSPTPLLTSPLLFCPSCTSILRSSAFPPRPSAFPYQRPQLPASTSCSPSISSCLAALFLLVWTFLPIPPTSFHLSRPMYFSPADSFSCPSFLACFRVLRFSFPDAPPGSSSPPACLRVLLRSFPTSHSSPSPSFSGPSHSFHPAPHPLSFQYPVLRSCIPPLIRSSPSRVFLDPSTSHISLHVLHTVPPSILFISCPTPLRRDVAIPPPIPRLERLAERAKTSVDREYQL
ncbi:hypothetical protein FB451DRAFT_106248 [Mycena latifolia]|nr:hypothetical protein FB451DRAFT_106248 [Mycena latifolia]